MEDAHETLRREADTLVHLLAQGVYLDRDRRHTDLWVWVVEQLMRARTQPNGTYQEWADNPQHYPALLAMRTAALAAVAARREDVLLRILREPTWRDRFTNNAEVPAFQALHDYRVLHPDILERLPTLEQHTLAVPAQPPAARDARAGAPAARGRRRVA